MYSVQQVLTVDSIKSSKLKDNLARIHREFVGKEGRLVEILSLLNSTGQFAKTNEAAAEAT